MLLEENICNRKIILHFCAFIFQFKDLWMTCKHLNFVVARCFFECGSSMDDNFGSQFLRSLKLYANSCSALGCICCGIWTNSIGIQWVMHSDPLNTLNTVWFHQTSVIIILFSVLFKSSNLMTTQPSALYNIHGLNIFFIS